MRTLSIFAALSFCLAACGGPESSSGGAGWAGGAGATATWTSPDTTTSSGGEGGQTGPSSCGGITGKTCPSDMYCDYPDDNCGKDDQTGTCQLRMDVCGQSPPICGCDGEFYKDICVLQSYGQDQGTDCEPPAGQFACGTLFCVRDTEYCLVYTLGDTSTDSCHDMPGNCTEEDRCACITWDDGTCEQDPESGQFTVRVKKELLE